MQHSLKLRGTNYNFKWVKVPGTAPYWKTYICAKMYFVWSRCVEICFILNSSYLIWLRSEPIFLKQNSFWPWIFSQYVYSKQLLKKKI
jgi:hypothetical protein